MAKKRRAHAHAHPALTFFHVSTRIIRIRLHAYMRFFPARYYLSRVCARTVGGDRKSKHVVQFSAFSIDLTLKIFTRRVVYANNSILCLSNFSSFLLDVKRDKRKGKNNFDISKLYMTEFTKHLFHQLYHSETKIEKETKKKKQRCEEKMRVAQLSRAKNFSSSLTLFFFRFSFFFRLFLLYLLHPVTQDNRVDIESGSSFSRPLATI